MRRPATTCNHRDVGAVWPLQSQRGSPTTDDLACAVPDSMNGMQHGITRGAQNEEFTTVILTAVAGALAGVALIYSGAVTQGPTSHTVSS